MPVSRQTLKTYLASADVIDAALQGVPATVSPSPIAPVKGRLRKHIAGRSAVAAHLENREVKSSDETDIAIRSRAIASLTEDNRGTDGIANLYMDWFGEEAARTASVEPRSASLRVDAAISMILEGLAVLQA